MEGTKTAGESALDLVRRIKTTSLRSSSKLDEHLPINAGSCTYIKVRLAVTQNECTQGKASSGKTELCLQYVLSCVLPETWGPIPLDGSASFALWFDLDVKLSMQRVLELISQRVQERVNEFISTNPSLDTQQLGGLLFYLFLFSPTSDFSMLMEETLSRFWICKCPSQLQFEATLHAIAHSNAYDNAKLIVIDSLDCFYWQDRFSSFSFRRGKIPG